MIWFNACDTLDKRVRYPYKETLTPQFARTYLAHYFMSNKPKNDEEIIYIIQDEVCKKEYSVKNLKDIANMLN